MHTIRRRRITHIVGTGARVGGNHVYAAAAAVERGSNVTTLFAGRFDYSVSKAGTVDSGHGLTVTAAAAAVWNSFVVGN
jgi:hypothetical protein